MTGRRGRSRRARRLALLMAALVVALALVALVALVAGAGAEESTEATTFGTDGIAGNSLGTRPYTAELSSVTARPDGGLLVRQGDELDSYLADGAPDPAAPPVAVPAGRTFPAAGGKSYVLDRRELTRLGTDGAPDPSFGAGGTAEAPKGTVAVVELGSGKVDAITINYRSTRVARTTLEVVTLRPDGRSGVRQKPRFLVEPFAPLQVIRETLATPDGGALVVGGDFLLRLRADGKVDEQFGSGGEIFGEGMFFAGAHLLAEGSIEAVGTAYLGGAVAGPAVERFTAAGRSISSFGTKGRKVLEAPDWERSEVASWGPDGSVIVGGQYDVRGKECAEEKCEEGPAVAAFDPSGDPVTDFGEGGIARLTALAGPPEDPQSYEKVGFGVTAIARRPDGSIVAVGAAPPSRQLGFLAALSPQGAPLPGFGEGGIVRSPEVGPASQSVVGLAPLADGGLLAAGTTDVGGTERPVLVRYGADGSLDRAFGAGAGFVDLPIRRGPTTFAVGDEEALVGSAHESGGGRIRLVMVRAADGSPVSSFGAGGAVTLSRRLQLQALLLGSDGDPVVLADPGGGPLADPAAVLRLRADGGRDPGFGAGGTVGLHGSGARHCEALAAAPDGGYLVGCSGAGRFVVAHLLANGELDKRYGNSLGWSIVPVAGRVGWVDVAQVGSRTYVAGSTTGAGRPHLVLACLDRHGHLVRGFGRDGRRTARIYAENRPTAIVPTHAGVVVTLENSFRPVVTFAPGGAVRQEAPGPSKGNWTFDDVHATATAGSLVVGWSQYHPPVGVGTYYLAARPLGAGS